MILLSSVSAVTVGSLGPVQLQADSALKDRVGVTSGYAESGWEA